MSENKNETSKEVTQSFRIEEAEKGPVPQQYSYSQKLPTPSNLSMDARRLPTEDKTYKPPVPQGSLPPLSALLPPPSSDVPSGDGASPTSTQGEGSSGGSS